MKNKFASEVKVRAALELFKGQRSATEIAKEIGCHPTLLKEWKDRLIAGLPGIFETKRLNDEKTKKIEELERIIGRLTIEKEFLKKVSESLGLK